MNKKEFFIGAMKAQRYRDLPWLIKAFSVTSSKKPTDNIAPFELYRDDSGHYVVSETGEFIRFEGADPHEPLYAFDERTDITPDDISNLDENINTRYGNILFNYLLVWSFGKKIKYKNKTVTAREIENEIAKRFEEDPRFGEPQSEEKIYVSERIKFSEAMFFLTGLSEVCVWAASAKTLLPPPGIKELRDRLLAENEGKLHELSTIAKINKELLEYDAKWLAGDKSGERFTTPGKARNVVRAKKFLMHGAEAGMQGDGITATLVPNSLYEGWDVKYFPVMNDSLRAGSFNRGAETMLGGVEVKWLYRATSNCAIAQDDCGSNIGSVETLTKENIKRFMGMTIIDDGIQTKLSNDDIAGEYLGKTIMVRNPMYCKLEYTDYCKVCVGDRLSVNPYGLASATTEYGSTFLSLFMKAMHGKVLKTAEMDIDSSIV